MCYFSFAFNVIRVGNMYMLYGFHHAQKKCTINGKFLCVMNSHYQKPKGPYGGAPKLQHSKMKSEEGI